MSKNLMPYYISRAGFALGIGVLMFLTRSPVWMAALIAGVILILFLLAPLSGRYSVHPELGITALRRDDRTQIINDKAGRNALVVSMLVLAGINIYYGYLGAAVVPILALKIILWVSVITYFISDLILRRV